MKILFLANLPPPLNGSSIVSTKILDFLKLKNNIDIIDTTISKETSNLNKWNFSKISTVFKLYKTVFSFTFNNYDIIYLSSNFNFFGYFKTLMFFSLIYLKGKKIFIHPHLMFRNDKLLKLFLRIFKKVFVISINKKLFGNRFYYLPNSNFNETKQFPKNDFKKVNLLFISHLYSFKGIIELIHFCKSISNYIDFNLDIVGSEGDISFSKIKDLINNLDLNSNIKIHGPVFCDLEKSKFFKNSNLIVYPTKRDFLPLFLIEAISYGVPVISSNIGSIDDIIIHGYNGFLVNDFSEIERLFKKIIFNKKKYKEFSKNSINHYNNNFSNRFFNNTLKNIFYDLSNT
jgi:glycosyltransferase involved in cell wall biosynthesis